MAPARVRAEPPARAGSPVRVLAITGEPPGCPSFRVRTALPAEALAAHGVVVTPAPLFADEDTARFANAGLPGKTRMALRARRRAAPPSVDDDGLEVAFVHRRAGMFPDLSLERRARRAPRLVYDVDDAIWLDARPGLPNSRLALLKGTPRKVRWLAAHADHVIAGNEFLAEYLDRLAPAVSIVPSLIDPERIALRRHRDSPRVVLGWIGTPSTARFMRVVRPALERVAVSAPDLRLTLLMVGGSAGETRGLTTETRPWTPGAEAEALARMDVGLMPLPDTPWNRGKCAYKALQYMAAGIPVVADDVGISASVVGPGRAGLIPATSDEWVEALLTLLRDASLRGRMGEEGRRRVERDFSVQRWAPHLAAILSGDRQGSPVLPAQEDLQRQQRP
jgi:glycosyltransferase involved in cell wall biosynthesis